MRNLLSKISNGVKKNEADIVLVIGVILISLISFGGGWLLGNSSKLATQETMKIEEIPLEELRASPTQGTANQQQEKNVKEQEKQPSSSKETQQQFVGSKNGTVYHFPWCPGAQQIKKKIKSTLIQGKKRKKRVIDQPKTVRDCRKPQVLTNF